MKLFRALSDAIVRDYCPGSDSSGIAVLSASEASALGGLGASGIFKDKHILVRSEGGGDPSWTWGPAAFSVIRPISGTRVQVQGARIIILLSSIS